MPIQILELVVKITIDENSKGKLKHELQKQAINKQELVDECVGQVIKLLQQEKER